MAAAAPRWGDDDVEPAPPLRSWSSGEGLGRENDGMGAASKDASRRRRDNVGGKVVGRAVSTTRGQESAHRSSIKR